MRSKHPSPIVATCWNHGADAGLDCTVLIHASPAARSSIPPPPAEATCSGPAEWVSRHRQGILVLDRRHPGSRIRQVRRRHISSLKTFVAPMEQITSSNSVASRRTQNSSSSSASPTWTNQYRGRFVCRLWSNREKCQRGPGFLSEMANVAIAPSRVATTCSGSAFSPDPS